MTKKIKEDILESLNEITKMNVQLAKIFESDESQKTCLELEKRVNCIDKEKSPETISEAEKPKYYVEPQQPTHVAPEQSHRGHHYFRNTVIGLAAAGLITGAVLLANYKKNSKEAPPTRAEYSQAEKPREYRQPERYAPESRKTLAPGKTYTPPARKTTPQERAHSTSNLLPSYTLTEEEKRIIDKTTDKIRQIRAYYDSGNRSIADKQKERLLFMLEMPEYRDCAFDGLRKEIRGLGK